MSEFVPLQASNNAHSGSKISLLLKKWQALKSESYCGDVEELKIAKPKKNSRCIQAIIK